MPPIQTSGASERPFPKNSAETQTTSPASPGPIRSPAARTGGDASIARRRIPGRSQTVYTRITARTPRSGTLFRVVQMTKPLRHTTIIVAALLAAAAAAFTAPSAQASPAALQQATSHCWLDVINDWLDNNRVDNVYAVPCYTQAIQQLSARPDIAGYSSAIDDIHRALLGVIRQDRNNGGGQNGGGSQPGPDSSSSQGPGGGGPNSSGGGGGHHIFGIGGPSSA